MDNFINLLTKTYAQWAQIIPIITVVIRPNITPPFLNAFGMAKIPLPKHAFKRWVRVSPSLLEKNIKIINRTGMDSMLKQIIFKKN